uniref:Uncharacterized protein n=1 Tax=Myotis myotis TaxID=51298 RepID=A0A7J7RMQ2_MYOMY|nr:hypothetical protein mMyoMyo1_010252 [Myotis myotis]
MQECHATTKERGQNAFQGPSWAFPRTMPFSLLAELVKCHPYLKMTANQNHYCQGGRAEGWPRLPFKMGSSRFSCSPEALGSVRCSWGCPLCVVWVGISCPALLRGSRSPVTGGARLERANGCGT